MRAILLDAFAALPLPPAAALEALAAKGAELARKVTRQDERTFELEREATALERQTASLAGTSRRRTSAALREARSARDAAWRALRLAEGKARAAAEIELVRRGQRPTSSRTGSIRRRIRVTTLARLRAESESSRAELEKARAERAKLDLAAKALEEELERLFGAAQLVPTDVTEMRQWVERHAQLADEHARLGEARAAVLAEATKLARAASDLVAALSPDVQRAKTEAQLSWLEVPPSADPQSPPSAAARLAI